MDDFRLRRKRACPTVLVLLFAAFVFQISFSLWTIKLEAFWAKSSLTNEDSSVSEAKDRPRLISLQQQKEMRKRLKTKNITEGKIQVEKVATVGLDKSSESFNFPLPKACDKRRDSKRLDRSDTAPKSWNKANLRTITSELQDLPRDFFISRPVTNREGMHMQAYLYDRRTNLTTVKSEAPIKEPRLETLVCFPDGIIVDNSIAGPFPRSRAEPKNLKHVTETSYYLEQNKRWHAHDVQAERFIQKKPDIHFYPGLGVQLSSSMGFTWNHFAVDTVMRLALVYNQLMDDSDPLWRNAKLVISGDLQGSDPSSGFDPLVLDVFNWLNLTDRLLSTNGWIIKANYTLQFDYLVLPDFSPYPMCGPNDQILDAVYPRHSLKPLQDALGAFASFNKKKYIVYAGRTHAKRNVEASLENEILNDVRNLLKTEGIERELVVFNYYRDFDRDRSKILELYRHTDVIIGPHGAQLWNAMFMPPGGLLMEFTTWGGEFADQDCRTYAYSLANAAGLEYALIDTDNFDYEGVDMLPKKDFILQALRDYWRIDER